MKHVVQVNLEVGCVAHGADIEGFRLLAEQDGFDEGRGQTGQADGAGIARD